MRPDRTMGLLALGLTLASCSPEEPSRDAALEASGATLSAEESVAGNDVPAANEVPAERPAAEGEADLDPDPQVGVELPVPPAPVRENPRAG